MNHKVIITTISCLIITIVVSVVVYSKQPKQPTQKQQQSPRATSSVNTLTAATSSPLQSVSKPTAAPPAVAAKALPKTQQKQVLSYQEGARTYRLVCRELIVKFRTKSLNEIKEVTERHNAQLDTPTLYDESIWMITLDGECTTEVVFGAIRQFEADPDVEFAQPNSVGKLIEDL